MHDSNQAVTAGFLEVLENQYCRKVPPTAILAPVTMDSGVKGLKLP